MPLCSHHSSTYTDSCEEEKTWREVSSAPKNSSVNKQQCRRYSRIFVLTVGTTLTPFARQAIRKERERDSKDADDNWATPLRLPLNEPLYQRETHHLQCVRALGFVERFVTRHRGTSVAAVHQVFQVIVIYV